MPPSKPIEAISNVLSRLREKKACFLGKDGYSVLLVFGERRDAAVRGDPGSALDAKEARATAILAVPTGGTPVPPSN